MREYKAINRQVVLVKPDVNPKKVRLLDNTIKERVMDVVTKEGLEVFTSSVKKLQPGDRVQFAPDTRKDDFAIVLIGGKEYLSVHYNRIIGYFTGLEIESETDATE